MHHWVCCMKSICRPCERGFEIIAENWSANQMPFANYNLKEKPYSKIFMYQICEDAVDGFKIMSDSSSANHLVAANWLEKYFPTISIVSVVSVLQRSDDWFWSYMADFANQMAVLWYNEAAVSTSLKSDEQFRSYIMQDRLMDIQKRQSQYMSPYIRHHV